MSFSHKRLQQTQSFVVVVIMEVEKHDVDQGLISPMFYRQLSRAQIPKLKKTIDDLTVFFCTFGI